MKNLNTKLLAIISGLIFFIGCSYANKPNNDVDSNTDIEILEKYSQPSIINGGQARAISKALDDFLSSDLIKHPINNYLVTAVELNECYYIQIYQPKILVTSTDTFIPSYCVNKESYIFEEIPDVITPKQKIYKDTKELPN